MPQLHYTISHFNRDFPDDSACLEWLKNYLYPRGIKCPKCDSKSRVLKTIFKRGFTMRFRKCNNKKCGFKFKSKETIDLGWDYKSICKKLKDELREVKF